VLQVVVIGVLKWILFRTTRLAVILQRFERIACVVYSWLEALNAVGFHARACRFVIVRSVGTSLPAHLLEIVVVRPGTVFGATTENAVITIFVKHVSNDALDTSVLRVVVVGVVLWILFRTTRLAVTHQRFERIACVVYSWLEALHAVGFHARACLFVIVRSVGTSLPAHLREIVVVRPIVTVLGATTKNTVSTIFCNHVSNYALGSVRLCDPQRE